MERKPESKVVSLRTETAYKADRAGQLAQRNEARGSVREVNAEVVQLEFAFLSGEIPTGQSDREVSRRNSTPQACGGSPEPVRCASTSDP